LAFFSNFVGRFRPFFTEGLTFFEKISLATRYIHLFTTLQDNMMHLSVHMSFWVSCEILQTLCFRPNYR